MSDHTKPSSLASLLHRLRRWLRHPWTTSLSPARELYADILRQAAQTQSLAELLNRFPERICTALELERFHIFILDHDPEGNAEYRLLDDTSSFVFPASSATVARMKRERRPSLFVEPGSLDTPEAWQLLATPAELDALAALGTQLLFPLEGRTRLTGFVSLGRPGRRAFSAAEIRFLRDLGPRMGSGLETALLVRSLSLEAVERDRSTRELLFAREVQEHLLPRHLPALPGAGLAAFYQSAEQVGGDYYDAFLTPGGSLCLAVADVSGKGVPAALVMAALRASLHALALQPELPLGEIVVHLNGLLYASSSSSRYATLFLCLYHPATGSLEYCNAGHNPPMLLRADGSLERLGEGGTVIGLLPGGAWSTARVALAPGDALVAYTDGMTEAVDVRGQEWSESGLEAALRTAEWPDAATLVRHLCSAHAAFTAGAEPVDDMTMLVLSCSSPEGPARREA